ncbi:FERM domain-containing protein 6-like isoform X1 [Gambusia affinis]|uniref:FERM domain-containing protein 6-like isoform X1 n=1 Tax=Gambusia affinis TaxID=33528 RepID=UPI001CDC4D51|nr:FERM domain-containing protein 6-like isoform X1 [Gambusia affinis]XP_043958860.1 FERM domain-containing protein 6-like isoform X1 [Gambusia affinis]
MRTKQMRQVRVLLPNKQHLDCSVRMRARGQEVMKTVLRSLGVGDLQVFGLALLRENEYLFLDLEQKLRKYFGKTWSRNSLNVPFIVFLRVKFYLENGLLILSSKVQQLYYWELRQKVLQSQNHQQEALLFQLAASALQAEAGDLERGEGAEDEGGDEKKERMQYFLPEDYFPAWLINHRGRNFLLQHSPVLHGELRGTPRSRAILQFIKEASGLQDAALTFYRMKQGENELSSSILLGVALDGVYIYQEVEGKKRVLFAFTWSEIDRFTFQGSRFEIAAVDSKLVYYTHSAFHSKHILKHLSDSHRFYVNSKDAACYIQQLEDMQTCQLHREAYICDMTDLRQRLRCYNLTGSESDCSNMETDTTWSKVGAEEEQSPLSEVESEEAFVDDPAEVTWLAEFLYGVSVDGPLQLPSSTWAAVTMEMKQVLCKRVGEASHSFDSQ